jgi:hypothetical protein
MVMGIGLFESILVVAHAPPSKLVYMHKGTQVKAYLQRAEQTLYQRGHGRLREAAGSSLPRQVSPTVTGRYLCPRIGAYLPRSAASYRGEEMRRPFAWQAPAGLAP